MYMYIHTDIHTYIKVMREERYKCVGIYINTYYKYIICIHRYGHKDMYTYIHIYVYIYSHIMYVYMYTYIYILYIYTHIYRSISIYLSILCVCILYIYILYTYIHIYICIYKSVTEMLLRVMISSKLSVGAATSAK
jgi:hypothetical protein